MKLTLELINQIQDLYEGSIEFMVIEDLEGKRRSLGMYGTHSVTFYTTYDDDDYDDSGNNMGGKLCCKELIISVTSIKGFEAGVGKPIYLAPVNLKQLAEGRYSF